jgi:two-component system, sensor histidine kinase PdtaS
VEYPEIRISLREEADGGLQLTIADNGVGLKQPFDPEANNSLGMQLIDTMAQQLEGTLSIANDRGLIITVWFQRTDAIREQDSAS